MTIVGNGLKNAEIKLGSSSSCKVINETTTKLICETTETSILDSDDFKNVSVVIR